MACQGNHHASFRGKFELGLENHLIILVNLNLIQHRATFQEIEIESYASSKTLITNADFASGQSIKHKNY